tara:strand:+ start:622 stop:1035 length:414 start_codon:yes stop_codon:yes gene_type:complete
MRKIILLGVIASIALVYGFIHSANRTEQEIPTQTTISTERTWNVEDSKAYANDVVMAWADNQYKCLNKLWMKESRWKHDAYNKIKVMGKNAGGIPQLLGMSPYTPAPRQIDRGFDYIMHRYGTPCMAWKFHEKNNWY